MKRLGNLFTCALLALATLGAALPLTGTFALQSGAAKARAYLNASTLGGKPLAQHLDLWMTPPWNATPILHYDVDMTKLLHLIIVSDDFTQFFHIHPKLGSDGHFSIDQSFPAAGLYHVYADAEPHALGQQVFRFDLPLGNGIAAAARTLPATGPKVTAGPYTVSLSTTELAAGKDSTVTVHVVRDGKPARDLHPYLGALAHAVFLDAEDLTYVHVHPAALGAGGMSSMPGMDMSMPGTSMEMPSLPDSASAAPDMALHVTVHEAGTYKLWLQFRGGSTLYVAPFVLTAS